METIEILKTRTISKRGGVRAGAGRKPRKQHEARELFNSVVDARWQVLLGKVFEMAEAGDKDMLRLLVEQRIGKPTQSLAVKDDHSTRVNYNLFYQPEVRKAVRVFEDQLKQRMFASHDAISSSEGD